MKSWLEKNDMEIIQHIMKENLVVAERFIRSLKTKIYTSVSPNVYIDKLDVLLMSIIIQVIEQLKGNLLMIKIIHILTFVKKLLKKILN